MFIQMITLAFHATLSWYLVGYCEIMDIRMTALSKTLTSLLNLVLILAYIRMKKSSNPKIEKSWIPWNPIAIDSQGVKDYMATTLPIAMSFYIEGLMFETSTIIAGFFPVNHDMVQLNVRLLLVISPPSSST